jgi:hypothetical protein
LQMLMLSLTFQMLTLTRVWLGKNSQAWVLVNKQNSKKNTHKNLKIYKNRRKKLWLYLIVNIGMTLYSKNI